MNEFLKAADDARRLLGGFKAVATIADAFEKVGQLQQAQGEAEVALEKLRADIEAAKRDAQTIAEGAAATKAEAEQLISDARWKADETVRKLIADAKGKAAQIEEKVNARADAAERRLSEAEARTQALAIDAEVKQKELADLESRIEQARLSIAKILGG
jgi:chromosome segregation ATPase